MKKLVALVLGALLIAGCSSASQQKLQDAQKVVAKVLADGKTVVVMGCKDAPVIESVANVVLPLIPNLGPAAGATAVVVEANVNAVCAKVLASQPS